MPFCAAPPKLSQLVTILLAASLAAGCRPPDAGNPAVTETKNSASRGDAPGAGRVLVRTTPLRVDEIRAAIEVTTDIEAKTRVDVYPKVGPAYVDRIEVDEGDVVRIGDPLCFLNDVDFNIALRRRESELAQAKQRLAQSKVMLAGAAARERMQQAGTERAQADYERALAAMKGDVEVLSAKEIQDLTKEFEMRQAELEASEFAKEQAQTDLDLADLSVEAAAIEVEAAQKDLAHTVVRSPIEGVVQERKVNTGVLVNSSTHLFTLVDPSHLIANLRVPQEELARVETGMQVEFHFDALPDRVFVGEVEALNPAVDPTSGLSKVRARLPQEAVGVVRPGMFSRARIVVESRADAVLISKRAIVYEGGRTWFFSVEDGHAARHLFEAGASTADEVEVQSVDGEAPQRDARVIVVGQDRLRDGDQVSVVDAEDLP